MKKTNLLLTFILSLSVTLTACQEVPEDVKSRAEEKEQQMSAAAEDSKAAAENGDFDPYARIPFGEVKKELEGYQFKHHDNLNFVCSPSPIEADAIYNIDMTWGSGTVAGEAELVKNKEVMKSFWGQDISDDQMVVEGQIITTLSKDSVLMGEMSKGSSAFGFWDFGEGDYRFVLNDIVLSNYTTGNYPKDMLKMIDGSELSVDEAIEQAEGYIKQLRELQMFDDEETLKLYRVAAGDHEGKGNMICLHYQQIRHGIPLDESGKYVAWQTQAPFFEIWFYGSKHLAVVMNWRGSIEKGKEEVTEIIPLSSAEYLAADGLAPKLNYNISEAELRYLCFADPEKPEKIRKYQPMWCFTAYEYPTSNRVEKFERVMIYIDAVTGDLYYSDAGNLLFVTPSDSEDDTY